MDLAKFNKFIEPKFNEKFAWGSNDCNTLILEYLDYMLGTETLKIAYKKYHTKFGAMKFQKKYQQRVSEKCLEHSVLNIFFRRKCLENSVLNIFFRKECLEHSVLNTFFRKND